LRRHFLSGLREAGFADVARAGDDLLIAAKGAC